MHFYPKHFQVNQSEEQPCNEILVSDSNNCKQDNNTGKEETGSLEKLSHVEYPPPLPLSPKPDKKEIRKSKELHSYENVVLTPDGEYEHLSFSDMQETGLSLKSDVAVGIVQSNSEDSNHH